MLLNWVNETETENWKIMQIWDLQIVNPRFDEVFGKEINRWLNWYEKYKEYTFDNERSINIFWDDFFIIEYKNKKIRDNDILQYERYFERDWKYKAKSLKNWAQVPENSGYFNYKWKYYLILYSYNRLTDEISDYIYKWIIVNPWEYFAVNNQVQKTSSQIKEIL